MDSDDRSTTSPEMPAVAALKSAGFIEAEPPPGVQERNAAACALDEELQALERNADERSRN